MTSVTSIVLIFLELLRKSRPACHEKKFDRFFLFESSTYLVERTENNQHDCLASLIDTTLKSERYLRPER